MDLIMKYMDKRYYIPRLQGCTTPLSCMVENDAVVFVKEERRAKAILVASPLQSYSILVFWISTSICHEINSEVVYIDVFRLNLRWWHKD
jgi:hypothetical protein